jgi:hypothetical protein
MQVNHKMENQSSTMGAAKILGGLCAIFLGLALGIKAADAQNADSLEVANAYRQLIGAENKHDIGTVKSLLYNSPGTMLVAKTKTKEEGGWAGFWGREAVGQHLEALVTTGTFQISPDYEKERITFIKADVAELYAPVEIAVSYAGQNPVPRPFLMVILWIKTNDGWKIQSDIAVPVPQN